ncbi:MAG: hypothetical protein RBT69_03430 [Spirochaetia bacterium]|jgi:cation:H+ antiporter|nr:hypothetical protein [Spirochaetia bacterium]
MVWVEFSIVSTLVIVFGYLLSDRADKLAEALNIGKGLIGFVLLGFATSIPELVSTLASTVVLDNPLLGSGNIIGSNNANLFILSASLLFASSLRKKGNNLDDESLVSVSFCFAVTSVFTAAVIYSGNPFVAGFSIFSYLIGALFFLSIFELHKASSANSEKRDKTKLSPGFYAGLIFLLVVLVGSSYYLSVVVDKISRVTRFGATASGALFLAWSTSLPELAVTVSAVIIGSSEMGIGNILGSNIFNMFVLAVAELFSRSSTSVFNNDKSLVVFSLMQLVLLSLLLLSLSQRKLAKVWKISILPLFSILFYISGMAFAL